MISCPHDTLPEVWVRYINTMERLGPRGRLEAAIEMSESVRQLQVDGIVSRNPGWSRREAERHLAKRLYDIDLPEAE